MKRILIYLLIILYPALSAAEECYLVVKNTGNYNPDEMNQELITDFSVPIISSYFRKVEAIPLTGIGMDACLIQLSLLETKKGVSLSVSGEDLYFLGSSDLNGIQGLKQSLLIPVYQMKQSRREEICELYGAIIWKQCQWKSPAQVKLESRIDVFALLQRLEKIEKQLVISKNDNHRQLIQAKARNRRLQQQITLLQNPAKRISGNDIKQIEKGLLTSEWFQKGNENLNLNQYQRAIEEYTKAIEIKPDFTDAYYNRGIAHKKSGQFQQAIMDYSQAIEIYPELDDAYYNRGITYNELAQYELAIIDFSKAIYINPDFADSYYSRGNVYQKLGKTKEFIEDYTLAIELNPQYPDAYYHRGNAYHKSGQYRQSINDYSKAIEIKPDDERSYNNRGNSYRKSGDIQRAIKDYTKAIKINPDFAGAFYNRAIAYTKLKKSKEIVSDFNNVLRIVGNKKESAEKIRAHIRQWGGEPKY